MIEGAAPVKEVLAFLARVYPGARVLLDHRNPFELLVATVLAAQCTDERVNSVTPRLGWHGRQVCVARKPRCQECGLASVCPKRGV
ncbi:MAG: hypothetical protein WAV26_02490 [Candidatus Deferrimicrobium sp.]